MRRAALVALLALPLLADGERAVVELPLERYEALRKAAPEAVSATVVESARFGGRFGAGGLTLVVEGRAIGRRPEVPLFTEIEGFELEGCDGTALVRRTGPGTLALVPLAERFRVTCRVAAEPGRERLSFTAGPAVLHADASVANGRVETGAEGDDGRAVALLRTMTSRQVLPVTATGRYRITLLPDEVAFRYEIALHNPNRDRTPYTLPLANGERVERTEPVTGEEADRGWAMEAPAGDSTLVLSGRLPGTRFVPPLEASAQMLLVETHPLVRADLEGPERRVSPAEVGVATEYRGGRAFLLRGREAISWKTSVVEALRTGDVVVQRAEHGLYLARDGGLLAETRLDLANQGAPELVVHVPDPLWASVQGRPVLLMPEKGGIRLPLDPGPQRVEVQHRARAVSFLGLLAARLPLASTPAETGHQRVTLALPAGWLPLAAAFGTDRRVPALPPLPFFGWLLLLALAAERALALVPPGRERWLLALALGAAGMTSSGAFWLVAGGSAAVGLLRLLARLREGTLTFGRALALSVALLLLVGVVTWRSATSDLPEGRGGLGALSSGGGLDMSVTGLWQSSGPKPLLAPRTMADTVPPQRFAEPMLQRGIPSQLPPGSAPSEYRGLPVRREVPAGERWLVLEQPSGGAARLVVLLVSAGWLDALRAALLATAALLVLRRRSALGRGLAHALREAGAGVARAARRPEPAGAATP